MAGVFLSYDRDDTDKARPIALALEKAGHEVWWDLHVRGGAQFSQVIEEALKAADAVVVLWSANSVKSAWVRDEAAAGRDSGRLIPATIDSTEPPMGFRQFQTINLSRWKGRGKSAELGQLLSAIHDLAPASPTQAERPSSAVLEGPKRPYFKFAAGGAIALAIAGAAGGWWFTQRSPPIPVVAVAAAEPSPQSQALARDLFVKLGRLQAANPDTLEIVDASAKRNRDFTFQVVGTSGAGHASANISLIGRSSTLLWSKDFERPSTEYSDLKQQLALSAAWVLKCATRALSHDGNKLDQTTLKLYLGGCASLSDLAWTDFRDVVPVFREVTQRAPQFEDGWARLVGAEGLVVGWEALTKDSPEGRALARDAAQARKLNPRMPEAYWADYVLLGESDVARSADILERARKDNPDDPQILSVQGTFLRRIGRMNDSVEAAKRAAELNPLSPDSVSDYIITLVYSGQFDAAAKEIEKQDRLWPGARSLVDPRYRFYSRYGDPKEALRIVHSGVNPGYAHFEPFLQARLNPTKKNIDRAIADARAELGQTRRGPGWLILALAQFGREEEIYSIVERTPDTTVFYSTEMFFRPEFRRFRQDIRFMKLMKRMGLVDYWRKSNQWPDFCFEADLPYDCKAEAAKLT